MERPVRANGTLSRASLRATSPCSKITEIIKENRVSIEQKLEGNSVLGSCFLLKVVGVFLGD
jgi:hypothetical protein